MNTNRMIEQSQYSGKSTYRYSDNTTNEYSNNRTYEHLKIKQNDINYIKKYPNEYLRCP